MYPRIPTIGFSIKWENTTFIDGSRNKHILQIKEALHIQLAGWDRLFNRDSGTITSECWRPILMRHIARSIAPPTLMTFHSTTYIVLQLILFYLCYMSSVLSFTSVVLFCTLMKAAILGCRNVSIFVQ